MPNQADRTAASAGTILVVDDSAAVRRMLRMLFEGEGFRVIEAATEAQTLSHLTRSAVSLITLDLALGGEDGLAIARTIRARSDVPIIMITAKGDEVERVVGLEVGADDYISKPFSIREVLARVRAVLRRSSSVKASERLDERKGYGFEGFELRLAERALTRTDGEPIELTSSEYRLLLAFVERPSHVLSRDKLLDLVGGNDAAPLERAIDTLVGRLRRKIEAAPNEPRLIKTVRGGGYVFAASVKPL